MPMLVSINKNQLTCDGFFDLLLLASCRHPDGYNKLTISMGICLSGGTSQMLSVCLIPDNSVTVTT